MEHWQIQATEGLRLWCEKNNIKCRIQYYCGKCGSFVNKDTLYCKVCIESDLLVE